VTRVGAAGEAALLERLRRRLGRTGGGVALGIGDDAAILERVGPGAVLTVDTLIEDVDFRLRWASFADAGHKAAAASLSDLAAMGARPRGLLVALGVRARDRVDDVLHLVVAADRLGRRFGAPVVGGDLSATAGPLVVSVTAVGEVAPRRAWRRGRARPDDLVFVSGRPGEAAAGLALLESRRRAPAACVRRFLRPVPRLTLALALARRSWVRACADVSDGLARDALHLPRAGCGVAIDEARLPLSAALRRAARVLGRDPVELALAGGEDFELVLAAPAAHRARLERAGLRAIGVVTRRAGLHLSSGRHIRGFEHFRDR
jgi:thiamine-monophosphate kinase